MKYKIEISAHQARNGEWLVRVKDRLPYYKHIEFERQVKEVMEENGFPIFKLVGVDE